jgi:PRTRC genetic system ThiF family protein
MEIEKRYRLELGEVRGVDITLVGVGGTGSFLALHLARLAYHARERHGLEVGLTLIDPDVVEMRNVGRQNFCVAEVGEPKAITLMRRLNAAFGLESQGVVEKFSRVVFSPGYSGSSWLVLLIGCVDNAAARREIAKHVAASNRRIWWLDCGNHESAGQVLLGNRADLSEPEISPMGFCSGLPLPSIVHPELLVAEDSQAATGASCAELALQDAQSLMINQMVAGWAAQYVYRMALARNLDMSATYVDLVSGSARSVPITFPRK